MSFSSRKTKFWTESEDKILKSLKEDYQFKSWSEISHHLFEAFGVIRSAKQCRDHYTNYLANYKSKVWSDSEIDQVFSFFVQYGTKWSTIAKLIQSKSESQIKNLFYSTIRRNMRKFNKGKLGNEKITLKSLRILENPEIREILTTKKKIGKNYFLNKFLTSAAVEVVSQQFKDSVESKLKIQELELDFEDENEIFGTFPEAVECRLDEIEPKLYCEVYY